MEPKLTLATRRELTESVRLRYRAADAATKRQILTEFISVSGYHPKSAIRVLNDDTGAPDAPRTRRRPCLYDEATKQALIVLWEASDRICGKRLKPLLRILIPSLERHGHLQLDETVRKKLLAMSDTTMDRMLRAPKSTLKPRKRRLIVPELRRRIAIRTFADWHEPPPGSMEMDLVAHCGGVARGSYVHSLVLTDVASAWTECTPLVVREKTLLIEALERVRVSLPFPLRALDVDNGGEFINEDLISYCVSHGIELTRSRPYRKNDQAWVEQKNGAVVRQMVGYRRLEGIAAAQMLARLYASLRFFVNFFQPSFKLMEKSRSGAQVTKRYHTPQTPAERLLTANTIAAAMKDRIHKVMEALDPLQLLEEIRAVQSNLVVLADGGQPYEPQRTEPDLAGFLGSLSSAWHAGEIRPTHVPTGTIPVYLRKIQIVSPPPAPTSERVPPTSDSPRAQEVGSAAKASLLAAPEQPSVIAAAIVVPVPNEVPPKRPQRKRPFAFKAIWPMLALIPT
jgi:hypothetical protein